MKGGKATLISGFVHDKRSNNMNYLAYTINGRVCNGWQYTIV